MPAGQHRRFLVLGVIGVVLLAVAAAVGILVNHTRSAAATAGQGFRCSATGAQATRHVAVTGLNPNGGADDYAAIQRAIDAAGRLGGGIVSLPAGTFMINYHLVLRDNVELTGVGPATVLKAGPRFLSTEGPAGGYPMISTAGAANTTIADLTANQSGNTLDANVPARLTGYVIEGRNSHNVMVTGVYVRQPFTYSIAMVASTDFCVTHSNILVSAGSRYDQLDGIHILDSSDGAVIGNVVQSGDDGLVAHTISGATHDVLYADNDVHGGSAADGLQLAAGDFPIYNIQIVDNNFYGSFYGIRTGYYDQRTGAVRNIVIRSNNIHDLTQASQSPAIDIGGFGGRGPVTGITVASNRVCHAGTVTVPAGSGNAVTGTARCGLGQAG